VLAQDVLEPILLERRSYPGAEVRFSTELVDLEQNADGVRATIVDRATGERTEVDARYLVAADGASSPVRQRLGIATRGADRIGEYLSVLFRADVDSIVGRERFGLYMLNGLGGPAPSVFVPTRNDGRWLLATPWRGDVRPLSTLGMDDLVGLVRRATGRSDLQVEIVDHQLVGIGAAVAERFRDGNVFLVGDAAHRTAPTGGTGMNTAIQSAHNLMWKRRPFFRLRATSCSTRTSRSDVHRASATFCARRVSCRACPDGGGSGCRLLVRRCRSWS
jgi:2-polyprenyl-6-methoxyphenol hydroxylase-like FAD-dependent oxidoreductase